MLSGVSRATDEDENEDNSATDRDSSLQRLSMSAGCRVSTKKLWKGNKFSHTLLLLNCSVPSQ